ncbi:conserved hypothetical protein [Neospora caninum Liverpool]|uniref:Transmembrane protein n=1 Tax=Neospora caninum (strain Liverpool) TaxID=572307 RepID=F0V985_NEOCL|nr:conserved hypothetical protein [Neospora caninum Liverpool]CBZ50310.1 conserved hypothetical protein [Neospora caninum Liverpool]CEL64916.1 TPA: hypothetical protein BN1204_007840 [Neospora caninum Liverpool]|eukprot:XP_003880344.1 conserved hypothetical protein [Neospora caninum Liverpool]
METVEAEQASRAVRDAWLKARGLSLVQHGLDEEEREFWWGLRHFLHLQLQRVLDEASHEAAAPSSPSSTSSRFPSSSPIVVSASSRAQRGGKRRRSTDSPKRETDCSEASKRAKPEFAPVSRATRQPDESVAGWDSGDAGDSRARANPLDSEEEGRKNESDGGRGARDEAAVEAPEKGNEARLVQRNGDQDGAEQAAERRDRDGDEPRGKEWETGSERDHGQDAGQEEASWTNEAGPKRFFEAAASPASSAYLVEGSDVTGERRISCFTQRAGSALELNFCLSFSAGSPPVYGHPATGVLLLLRSALRTRCSSDGSLSSRQQRNCGIVGNARENCQVAADSREPRSLLDTLKRMFSPVAHEDPARRRTREGQDPRNGERDRNDETDESVSLSMLVLDHHVRLLSAQWIADWIVLYWLSLFQAVFSYLAVRGVYAQRLARRALARPLCAFFSATADSPPSVPASKGEGDSVKRDGPDGDLEREKDRMRQTTPREKEEKTSQSRPPTRSSTVDPS